VSKLKCLTKQFTAIRAVFWNTVSKYKTEPELCELRAIHKTDLGKHGWLSGKCFLPTIFRQWRTIFRRIACHWSVLHIKQY